VTQNYPILKYADLVQHRFEAVRRCLLENLKVRPIDKVEGDDIDDKDYYFKDLFLEL
jgi:hypothetical protein